MDLATLAQTSSAPFPFDPVLTAIVIAYRNQSLIADTVLPRSPVGGEKFKYRIYDLAEGYTVPDTKVGRKSEPAQVEFTFKEEGSYTEDFGLDDIIPNADIENAPQGYDPAGRAVEGLTDLVQLDREVRTANLVFNPATYPAANRLTLSGSSQFNDYAISDPMGVLDDAMDGMILRPNTLVIGRQAFTKLRRHPQLVKAMHGTSGDSGRLTAQQMAEVFEVDQVVVGEPRVNVARKGQAPVLQRVWGKHIALLHLNKLATTEQGVTFGLTAQYGTRVGGQRPEPNIGLRGSVRVRAGESVRECITAPDAGFFIQNVVA